MLHRNTLIAVCAIFCAVAVGAGLFVANLSKQSGLVIQPPGVSATGQPTAVAGQATPIAAQITTMPEPTPTDAPIATRESAEPTAANQAAPTSAAAYVEYTVQKGDLLNNIAKKYNVTTKDILAINQIPNADSLAVGQVLRIPKI
jgi:LysM repeat protein